MALETTSSTEPGSIKIPGVRGIRNDPEANIYTVVKNDGPKYARPGLATKHAFNRPTTLHSALHELLPFLKDVQLRRLQTLTPPGYGVGAEPPQA